MKAVPFALCVLLATVSASAHRTLLLTHFFDLYNSTPADVRSIARFDLDVDGDGRPELFLGLPGNQYGQDWSVYKLRGDGTSSPLGPIRFHYEAFYYDLVERRLWASVRVTASTGGWTQFRLTRSGFVEDTNPGKRDLEKDMARARSWHRPPVGWAVVTDLLGGMEAWRDLQTQKDVLPPVGLATLAVR